MSAFELILCGFIVLLGLIFLLIGLGHRRREQASASWPSVQGRMLSSEIKKQVYTTGDKGNRRTDAWYQPAVRYEYVVDGARYEAGRVASGAVRRHTEGEVQQVLEHAMPGGSLRVFYNPRKPKDALLLNRERSGSMGYLVAGAVIVAAAAVLALVFFIS